ncbi:MAG: ferredoxin [Nanoarchaeota archaeon]
MAFKISVNKETCIGCGSCAEVCSNFKLVDGKSVVKKTPVKAAGCNVEAKNICPTHSIKVEKA